MRLDPIRARARDCQRPRARRRAESVERGRRLLRRPPFLGPHVAHVLLAARSVPEPSALLVDCLRAATGAGLAVWLVPPGRDPPIPGARAIAFELAPSFRGLLPAIVVAPWSRGNRRRCALGAPGGAALRRSRQEAGAPRRRADGAAQRDRFPADVETVAAARGAPVPKEELQARLSPHRLDDAMVRQAKARTLEAMVGSFADAGREAPADRGRSSGAIALGTA